MYQIAPWASVRRTPDPVLFFPSELPGHKTLHFKNGFYPFKTGWFRVFFSGSLKVMGQSVFILHWPCS
jgi:hypothetical protein